MFIHAFQLFMSVYTVDFWLLPSEATSGNCHTTFHIFISLFQLFRSFLCLLDAMCVPRRGHHLPEATCKERCKRCEVVRFDDAIYVPMCAPKMLRTSLMRDARPSLRHFRLSFTPSFAYHLMPLFYRCLIT